MQSFLVTKTEAMFLGSRGHSQLENRLEELYLAKKPLSIPAKNLFMTQFLLVLKKKT